MNRAELLRVIVDFIGVSGNIPIEKIYELSSVSKEETDRLLEDLVNAGNLKALEEMGNREVLGYALQ